MCELLVTLLLAALLLAAASHRFRSQAGLPRRAVPVVRVAAAVLGAAALARCGTHVDGERLVRWTVALSLASAALVLALSVMPGILLHPLRWATRRRRPVRNR